MKSLLTTVRDTRSMRGKRKSKKMNDDTLAVLGNRLPKETLPMRSKSLPVFNKERETWTDRYSVPLLPDYDYKISLNDRILIWQSQSGEGFFFKESVSINSLPIIVAEIEKVQKETTKN